MKLMCILISFLLITSTTFAYELTAEVSAGTFFDNCELVVGNKVARYVGEIDIVYRYKWFMLNPTLTTYGVQTWKRPELNEYNLDAEEWRSTGNILIELGPKEGFKFWYNHYEPLGSWSRKGPGSLESYHDAGGLKYFKTFK